MTSAWKDFYCWTDRRSFICKFYYTYPAHRRSNKQTAIRVRRSGRTWWSWKPLSPGSLLSWSGPPLAYGRFPSRPHRCTPGTSSCGQAARSTRTGSCHTKKAPCSSLPCIHQYACLTCRWEEKLSQALHNSKADMECLALSGSYAIGLDQLKCLLPPSFAPCPFQHFRSSPSLFCTRHWCENWDLRRKIYNHFPRFQPHSGLPLCSVGNTSCELEQNHQPYP